MGYYDTDIRECMECYLNLPEMEQPENNPLSYAYIREQQQADNKLLQLLQKHPQNYIYMDLDDDVEDIICYKSIQTHGQVTGKLPYQNQWYQR